MPPLVRSRSSNSAFVHSLLKGSSFSTLAPGEELSWKGPLELLPQATYGNCRLAGDQNPDGSFYIWTQQPGEDPPQILRWHEIDGLSVLATMPNDPDVAPGILEVVGVQGQSSITYGNTCYFFASQQQTSQPTVDAFASCSSAGSISILNTWPQTGGEGFRGIQQASDGRIFFIRQSNFGNFIDLYQWDGSLQLLDSETPTSPQPRLGTSYVNVCDMVVYFDNQNLIWGYRISDASGWFPVGGTQGLDIWSGEKNNRWIGLYTVNGAGTLSLKWQEFSENLEGNNLYEDITGNTITDSPNTDVMFGAALSTADDRLYAIRDSTTDQALWYVDVNSSTNADYACPIVIDAEVIISTVDESSGWRNQGACGGGGECEGGVVTWRTPDCSDWLSLVQNAGINGAGIHAYYKKYRIVIRATICKSKDAASANEFASMQSMWSDRLTRPFFNRLLLTKLPIEKPAQLETTCWWETNEFRWSPSVTGCAQGTAEPVQIAQALWFDDTHLDIDLGFFNRRIEDTSTPEGQIDCTSDWSQSPLVYFAVGRKMRPWLQQTLS